MTESMPATARLDALLQRHARSIDHAVAEHGLPLHVVFLEEAEAIAQRFAAVASDLYPETLVVFAAKSNPCRGAIRAAGRFGLGVDAASEYEMLTALQEGVPPERIVCNGNAKTSAYLDLAVRASALVALDNRDELDELESIAETRRASVRCLVRFRGLPLSGLTSADQTTAADWTKFGFHVNEADDIFTRIRDSKSLALEGISAHIGTQIVDPVGYERLMTRFLALADRARAIGLELRSINIGGGYPVRFLSRTEWTRFTDRLRARLTASGIPTESVTWNDIPMGYDHLGRGGDDEPCSWIGKAYWSEHPGPEMLAYLLRHRPEGGPTIVEHLRRIGSPRLIIEPGRSLMAPSGITLTEVAGVKEILGHSVVSLDMGINNHGTNLITPDIFPAAVLPRREGDDPIEAFLAGRLCFSGDMISKAKVTLNRRPTRGERFVLYQTGAYSADHFASNSCGFPRPAKVALRPDGTLEVWRRSERFADVFGEPNGESRGDWRDVTF